MLTTSHEEYKANRKAQVENALRTKLAEITEVTIPELKAAVDKHAREDVYTYFLNGKGEEIQMLKKEISSLENAERHFTKQYRTYEGHCGKLQTELDRIDVFGREDLKAMRKKHHAELADTIKMLSSKVHSNGMVCSKCEVQT